MASKIFIIAGEASGDSIGAKLIRELRKLDADLNIQGIGGTKMERENFESLFPMQDISLMGLAEIVPHLPKLLRRLKQTEQKIREFQPDIIVTIDSPGFNFRTIKNLQDLRNKIKFIHYVAPTVWAYKPERAAKVAALYDHLLVILPFEPVYFEKEGLATTFIGHPITEDGLDKGNAAAFKARHKIDDFICMMPGSRFGELKRNMPIFKQVAENLNTAIVIIAADNVHKYLEQITANWKVRTLIIDNSEKADCFAACKAGLIKSGTSALEFAFANKPYVTVYKVSKITHLILKRLIKIPFANLLNIIADKELIKELIQENFTSDKVTNAMQTLLENDNSEDHRHNLLKLNSTGKPSELAAKIIMELTKNK